MISYLFNQDEIDDLSKLFVEITGSGGYPDPWIDQRTTAIVGYGVCGLSVLNKIQPCDEQNNTEENNN